MVRTTQRTRHPANATPSVAPETDEPTVENRSLPDPKVEPTITLERAAIIIGVSHRHAYNLARKDEFPAIQVGTKWVVPTWRFLVTFDLVDSANSERVDEAA